MELLTLEDIMQMLGISRRMATRILTMKGCPVLPRTKGGKYLVPRDSFIRWLNR